MGTVKNQLEKKSQHEMEAGFYGYYYGIQGLSTSGTLYYIYMMKQKTGTYLGPCFARVFFPACVRDGPQQVDAWGGL